MTPKLTAKLALATLGASIALASTFQGSFAADLGGSLKDGGGYTPAPVAMSMAGPCYVRGDVGYSLSRSPSITWPVSNSTYNGTGPSAPGNYVSSTYAGDSVSNTSMDNGWLGEIGVGCGSGSRGIRGELMLGYRGSRNIEGTPQNYTVTYTGVGGTPAPYINDPLHSSLTTYTAMLNGYKDLGNFSGFVPYAGAGVGLAYHELGDVSFTGNPLLVNQIKGNRDVAFAWSLMTGFGYQMSERSIIDVGYRYIDMGKIESGRIDSANNVNPAVKFGELTAHEFKVGLRYHFGGSDAPSFSMK